MADSCLCCKQMLDAIIYNIEAQSGPDISCVWAIRRCDCDDKCTIVKLPISTEKIAEFCQRWRIQEFSLFGSVLNERFQEKSDVDVLVTFAPEITYTFGQLEAMQESQNYIRRHDILDLAQVIYQVIYAE